MQGHWHNRARIGGSPALDWVSVLIIAEQAQTCALTLQAMQENFPSAPRAPNQAAKSPNDRPPGSTKVPYTVGGVGGGRVIVIALVFWLQGCATQFASSHNTHTEQIPRVTSYQGLPFPSLLLLLTLESSDAL